MKFSILAKRAKRIVDERGGVEALKADAQQLKDIAKGEGSLGTKAGAAVAAIKDAGARGEDEPDAAATAQPEPAAAAEPAPAGEPSNTTPQQ